MNQAKIRLFRKQTSNLSLVISHQIINIFYWFCILKGIAWSSCNFCGEKSDILELDFYDLILKNSVCVRGNLLKCCFLFEWIPVVVSV